MLVEIARHIQLNEMLELGGGGGGGGGGEYDE